MFWGNRAYQTAASIKVSLQVSQIWCFLWIIDFYLYCYTIYCCEIIFLFLVFVSVVSVDVEMCECCNLWMSEIWVWFCSFSLLAPLLKFPSYTPLLLFFIFDWYFLHNLWEVIGLQSLDVMYQYRLRGGGWVTFHIFLSQYFCSMFLYLEVHHGLWMRQKEWENTLTLMGQLKC